MTAISSTQSSNKPVDLYEEFKLPLDANSDEINLALQQAEWSISAMTQVGKTADAEAKRELLTRARQVFASDSSKAEYDRTLIREGIYTEADFEARSENEDSENRKSRAIIDEEDNSKVLKSEVQEDNGFRFVVTELDMSQKAQLERLLPLATLIQYQNTVQNEEKVQEASRVTPRLPLIINPSRESMVLKKYLMVPGVIEGLKLPELNIVEGSATSVPVEFKKAA